MKKKILFLTVLPLIVILISGCTHSENNVQTNDQDTGALFDGQDDLMEQENEQEQYSQNGENLDLRNQGINEFPEDVLDRGELTSLDLSGNNLESLPPRIGNLTNLEELFIEDNRLSGMLPAEIGNMINLLILDLSGNALTGVPAEIGQLENLAALDLSSNNISVYPAEIENLQNLQIINLENNNISEEDINRLREALPDTTILN